MRKLLIYIAVIFASAVLAGCGGSAALEPTPADSTEAPSTAVVEEVPSTEGTTEDASTTGLGGTDDTSELNLDESGSDDGLLSQRVVYFAFDSSILTPEAEAVMRAHADHLSGNLGVQIVLEGHADERGTREYNLALAEERARSATNLMQALGVSPDRIQTISYGEERPAALGHDESSWMLNRRVEILY